MSDAAALETLLDENGSDLYSYLVRRSDNPDDAEDALSEVFLTAWRRRDGLPEDAHEARLWLFGVAANTVRNQQRAHRRRYALVRRLATDRSSGLHRAQSGPSDQIRDAIDSLPNDLAELVRLHHWEGFTLAEVASILNVPAATVRTRYRAARRRLRETLSVFGDEESSRSAGQRVHTGAHSVAPGSR